MASLGRCCRHSERVPQSHNYWDSCSLQGKIGKEEMEDKRDMVTEVARMQNLGRTEIFSWIEDGYFGLCGGGGGVGSSGGVNVSDGRGVFRSLFLVFGGGGMFSSGFLVDGR